MKENLRKKVTFSLSPDVILALQAAAKLDGRNTSRFLEALIFSHCGMRPKGPRPPLKLAKQV
jgi:hypothetical protein